MKNKAIIIGAGVAGPIVALQLKETGYDTQVYEARSESDLKGGAFLGITPNGLNVLKQFILLDELREEYTPGSMRFYNRQGAEIGALPTDYQKTAYGAETIQVKRHRLNQLVRKAAEERGVCIAYGKKCVGVHEQADGVEVQFEDGQVVEGNILIGCDGTFSAVRKSLFPEVTPSFTHNISTGGYARLPELTSSADAIHMTFGERGFFAYSVSNQGEIWWFNNYYRQEEPSREEVNNTLPKEIKDHLLAVHKNDDPLFSRIVRATDNIVVYPVYDIGRLKKWHTERICLLGDAAHATSPHVGQGASLALEDAVCLANCLKKFPLPEDAFSSFQQLRQGRVEKIIKQARKVGDTKSKPNPLATWFRDRMLRYFIKSEIKKLDWVYGYRVDN